MDRNQIKSRIRGGSVESPKKVAKATTPKPPKAAKVKKVETTPPAADQGEPQE